MTDSEHRRIAQTLHEIIADHHATKTKPTILGALYDLYSIAALTAKRFMVEYNQL